LRRQQIPRPGTAALARRFRGTLEDDQMRRMSRSKQARALFCAALLVSSVAAAQPDWAPPPEPQVSPQIPATDSVDADRNRIEDTLDDTVAELRASRQSRLAPDEVARPDAELEAPIGIELVFSRQVTQEQIDAFLALGGEIDHMFQAVSYGWTGRLSRGAVESLPGVMGASLVVVVEDRPLELMMDEATRAGRVRPVWASGFAGSGSGFSGNSNITIAIIDTGVDDSHPDLAGRMEYWMDYTADAEPTPRDVRGHGSHVAGIALGTGAGFGLGPGTLTYTDSASLAGFPAGTGALFMMHLPPVPLTFTHDATWLGGGMADLFSLRRANGGGSVFAPSAPTNGPSGIVESNTFMASTANGYSSGLTQNAGGTVGAFAIVNTVSTYPAVGDGFNALRGVAPASRWAGAKVFTNAGAGGSSTFSAAFDDMVVQRITHNIKVANMSIGVVSLNPTLRAKANTMVNNGIVVAAAVGNLGPGTVVGDPARASLVMSVTASNDINELTTYPNSGFLSPGPDEDNKPDLMAPGGSNFQSQILSVDSNDADADTTGFADRSANDYRNQAGTSMSSPFVAGAASLVIDALQQAGLTWDFSSSAHPLLVKMLLCASATESNANREAGSGSDPTLGRAVTPKDRFEGYGLINPDAAIEAVALQFTGVAAADSTTGDRFDRRAWGRKVVLTNGASVLVNLSVPAAADYDLYLYSSTPDSKGNPVILASSTNAGVDVDESIFFVPSASEDGRLFVKRVAGSGAWSMSGVFGTTSTSTSSTSTSSTSSTTLPPTDLLPGRIVVIKPDTLAKFVAKPVTGDTFTLPTVNPVASGGSLRIFDTAAIAGDNTFNLAAGAAWKGLGNPAGSKGYKYKGVGSPTDPCKVVLVKEKVIKGVCKGSGITLAPPFPGEVGIVLSLGATDRYCASFGGDEVKNDGTLTKRKNAPAPGGCP